jgi:bifunctional NMN adenylyltransferase/nudix hydrolase
MLLGKKAINNKWRFIGGFVDPEDERLENAALREL